MRTTQRFAGLGVLVAFLLALWPALPAAAHDEDTIVQLVNEARWAEGKPGLVRNPALDAVALAWAQQMAASNTMSHNPSYTAQVPPGWSTVGENVAYGQRSAGQLHQAWMDSPGHRANILGDYTDIGVAYIDAGGTTWAVENFGGYAGHVGPAAPAPAPAPAPAVPDVAESEAPIPIAPEPLPSTPPTSSAVPDTPAPAFTPEPTLSALADPAGSEPTPAAQRDADDEPDERRRAGSAPLAGTTLTQSGAPLFGAGSAALLVVAALLATLLPASRRRLTAALQGRRRH